MIKSILLCLMLTGCGCNVSKGDDVIQHETGRKGNVLSVNSDGGGTDECKIAVKFNNGDVLYWAYGFEFEGF